MELWDGYNERLETVGVDLVRGEPIPAGLLHVVVEVLVVHTDGDILLMQRDWNKIPFPGMFEASAGGALQKGEDFETGARRELLEETGIQAQTLEPLYRLVRPEKGRIYLGYLYRYDGEKEAITLQEGETISYRWLPREQFPAFAETKEFAAPRRERLVGYLRWLCREN